MVRSKSYIKNVYTKDVNCLRKKCEPWTVVYIGRPLSAPLAKGFARLHIHPNIITILSFIFTIFSGYFFFCNRLILGAVLYFIGYILDCADGSVARLTDTTSKFGERLDYYTDIFGNVFMYFGLWYSQYYLFAQWFTGGFVIVLHYFTIVFGYVFLKNVYYKTISPKISSYYAHCDEGFLTFFFAPLTGIFYLVFPVLVLLQLVSYVILFFTQKEKPDIIKNIKSMLKL